MGSWYETCMLSNLPIREDDEIVAFVIARPFCVRSGMPGLEQSTYCYANGEYTPISLPIYGEYGDYGKIINIDTATDASILQLNAGILGVKADGLEDHINDIIRRSEREHFAVVYILRSIYDEMVERTKKEKTWRSGDSTREESLLSQIDKEIEVLAKNEFRPFSKMIYDLSQQTDLPYDKVIDLAKDSEDAKAEVVSLLMFISFLESARKRWYIPSGSGSQDAEYDLMIAFNKSVTSHAEAKIKEWEES